MNAIEISASGYFCPGLFLTSNNKLCSPLIDPGEPGNLMDWGKMVMGWREQGS
jgi:hypothetical protein